MPKLQPRAHSAAKTQSGREPVWKGPTVDGVTFSLLSRYLCCQERFRLMVIEGLKPIETFSQRLHYGQMWHVCEEALAAAPGDKHPKKPQEDYMWEDRLKKYCQDLCRRFPFQQPQVVHWYNVCKTQFPIYVEHWSKHPDVVNRQPLLQEQEFNVQYVLPSACIVRLRGKWDAVDGIDEGLYIQEDKTKGDIEEQKVKRQLQFDLQTMIYVVSLLERKDESFWRRANKRWRNMPVKGVRYNVVRRPLSGGKHSISKLQNANRGKKGPNGKPLSARPETDAEYYARLGGLIAGEPEHYFQRWRVEVDASDVTAFKRASLDPILENLSDDYEWWAFCYKSGKVDVYDYQYRDTWFPHHRARHYRLPYGVYNPLIEGGSSEVDEYLASGSMAGLTNVTNLFPELG